MNERLAFSHVPRPRTIPDNAPRPTAVWLATAVITFLGIYYQPDESDPVFEGMVELWKATLADLPAAAIEGAMAKRLRTNDRSRPIPGEILETAMLFLCPSRPALSQAEVERLIGGNVVPLITAEKARELVAEEVLDANGSTVPVPKMVQRLVAGMALREQGGSDEEIKALVAPDNREESNG